MESESRESGSPLFFAHRQQWVATQETGEYKLLEVNPRFWATVQMEIHAGFDFPYYYWQLVQGEHDHSVPRPTPGIASHYLLGELSYLLSVLAEDHPICDRPSMPSTVWEMARSIVRRPRFDLLDRDDPLPFVSFVATEVGSRTVSRFGQQRRTDREDR